MKSIRNKVNLIGRLGKDVELKELESGRKMARLSLATNDFYKNSDGERVEETQWHNLVAWGKLAEHIEALCKKGMEIAVEGKLNYREYDDKEGVRRKVTDIIISDFVKLTPKSEALPF